MYKDRVSRKHSNLSFFVQNKNDKKRTLLTPFLSHKYITLINYHCQKIEFEKYKKCNKKLTTSIML